MSTPRYVGNHTTGSLPGRPSTTCQRPIYAQSVVWKVKGRSESGDSMNGYLQNISAVSASTCTTRTAVNPTGVLRPGLHFQNCPTITGARSVTWTRKLERNLGRSGHPGSGRSIYKLENRDQSFFLSGYYSLPLTLTEFKRGYTKYLLNW